MTISSTVRTAGPYTGTGLVNTYPFAFKVFQAGDLLAQQTDTSGNITTLVLTTNYSVTLNADQNASPGGSIVLNSNLPNGYELILSSQVAELQGTSITNNGGFYPQVLEDALDYLTILTQQLQTGLTQCMQLPLAVQGVTTTLPAPVAGQLIGWNAAGTALVNLTPSGLGAGSVLDVNVAANAAISSSKINFNQPATNQFFSQNGAVINRFNDRIFLGGATASDGSMGSGGSADWVSQFYEANGYATFLTPSMLSVETNNNPFSEQAIFGGAQSMYATAANSAAIGLYGLGVNNNTTYQSYAWGAYIEGQQIANTGGGAVGIEISTRNMVASQKLDPYNTVPSNTTVGLQLSCGCGVASTGQFDGTAALIVTSNPMTWNSGIVFRSGSVTVNNSYSEAMSLPSSYAINWYAVAGAVGASIRSSVTSTTAGQMISFTDGTLYITTQGGHPLFQLGSDPSFVNFIVMNPSATGGAVSLAASGSDANVDFKLVPKGTGLVQLGTAVQNATNSANFVAGKYIRFKDASGTTYYLPVSAASW